MFFPSSTNIREACEKVWETWGKFIFYYKPRILLNQRYMTNILTISNDPEPRSINWSSKETEIAIFKTQSGNGKQEHNKRDY